MPLAVDLLEFRGPEFLQEFSFRIVSFGEEDAAGVVVYPRDDAGITAGRRCGLPAFQNAASLAAFDFLAG